MSVAHESRMACHECDLLVNVPDIEPGEKAFCPRCGYLLAANRPNARAFAVTFSMTALLFLLLSLLFPFLGFSANGQDRTVTLLQSVGMLLDDLPTLAVLVFASIILIPCLFLIGVLYVSGALTLQKALPGMRRITRWTLKLMPWSMAEIFIIGILVSFVKIVTLADVALGLSFWAYATFTVSTIAVVINVDRRTLWREVNGLVHG